MSHDRGEAPRSARGGTLAAPRTSRSVTCFTMALLLISRPALLGAGRRPCHTPRPGEGFAGPGVGPGVKLSSRSGVLPRFGGPLRLEARAGGALHPMMAGPGAGAFA